MTPTYSTDIVIFGGGIAGLWLLNRLSQEGYGCVLLESNGLGGGQTRASQGIIHGGLKYALGGALSGAANTIASMPQRWRDCLSGTGDIDLTGTKILSENYYMWSESNLRSKLKTFLGSKSLRGRVEALETAQYSEFFKQSVSGGSLYKLPDFVVDTDSLLHVLSRNQMDKLIEIKPDSIVFERNNTGKICAAMFDTGNGSLKIQSQQFIFCAGEANQELIDRAELKKPQTQIRPLKMVYLRQARLPAIYVHCIGNSFSLTPRLTVTSHTTSTGEPVWYLGGDLAEKGVMLSDDGQIEEAKKLTSRLFPWVDFNDADWQCFSINRAEASVNENFRPDDAIIIAEDNAVAAWPTKLTLTPSLADKVVNHLRENKVVPGINSIDEKLVESLPRPQIASPYWN